MDIRSERLAFWFLRLNGFLTIPNFIVHPEGPRLDGAFPQQTDVDVLGVRFPFRAENRARPMGDFALFLGEQRRPMVVLSEVKTGRCGLNGPWTDPKRENMEKVLHAGGFRPAEQVDDIAQSLYRSGIWQDDELVIRILCFGAEHNAGIGRSHPEVHQLLWQQDVLPFVYQRFFEYRLEKQMHHQWDDDVKELFAHVRQSSNEADFLRSVSVAERT
ncbi:MULTISPECIES: hypothetical protein [unclassified Variovorax]|uniref:hypothetical protein n=1 Tax=unclassified Variovorax TaxID=663243 RepID=UPI0008B05F44|nr:MULTISPECIES: hypothetical protein [unclassified Variovorax]SEK16236.1 hypothetical protein SAMN05518853_12320 [Variovorax sp. OK202]SFE42547.1 hypothetical protein SAMN05444746_12420 [Variovorax sp. OK212]